MGNKLSLTVKESGMDETMLQSVLKQFTKYESLIQDTAQKHPDKIEQAVKPMQQELFLCNFCDDLFVCILFRLCSNSSDAGESDTAWTAAQCMRNEKKYDVCG